jgi:hypothetical protein
MWPWEHLAFAYLLYSPVGRLVSGAAPQSRTVLALFLAALLPDLIDKPLAWVFGVLPAGRSLGHSLLFAVPLIVVVAAVFRFTRTPTVGLSFGVGYLSHLAGDVIYPLVTAGEFEAGFLLWPIVAVEAGPVDAIPHFLDLVDAFLAFLATPRGALYFLFEVTLVTVAFVVWVLDDTPGLGRFSRDRHR